MSTLQEVGPFAKTTLRRQARLGKKNRKSYILIDSLVKDQLKLEKKIHIKKEKLPNESDKRGERNLTQS